MTFKLSDNENSKGELRSHAEVGGYPIYYLCADGEPLCAKCANAERALLTDSTTLANPVNSTEKQWHIVGAECNFENDALECAHCNGKIECAYGDD
jgi:hypothetical protein